MIKTSIYKKAQVGTNPLVVIIITLVVFIVLVTFYTGAFEIFDKTTVEQKCRLSVLAQQVKMYGNGLIALKCPRKEIKITDQEANVKYNTKNSEWKQAEKFKESVLKDEKQLYKIVADEMADCWYKMGEGGLNVFNENYFFGNDKLINDLFRHPCLICSQITFDIRTEKNENLGTGKDIKDYLKRYNYTRYGNNIKYYDYINREYPELINLFPHYFWIDSDSSIFIKDDMQINTEDNYVIFFKAFKIPITDKKVREAVGKDESDHYYMFFSEPEKMLDVCEILVN